MNRITSKGKYLGNPIANLLDGESNAIEFDIAYPVSGNLAEAVKQVRDLHGNDICLLPMSGTSSGGGIFQFAKKAPGMVVGLKFEPPVNPRISFAAQPHLATVALDEIVIDREHHQICAGSSITLDQLNQALAVELGHGYKVPGADLTSYLYAAVGATFMTGGMGPQRRYFSDSVIEVALYDGNNIVSISGEPLRGYAGTYGWTGMISALRCNYYQFPDNEIAFALPLSNRPAELAKLLAHLAPYCYLDIDPGKVGSGAANNDLILGIEHVSSASMQPLMAASSDNPAHARAQDLQQKCNAADADGLVFVNGFSDRSIDEFLIGLADDEHADSLTIAGIDLEYAEVFNDPETMRAVREAIPYAARMQKPAGRLLYKNHTDANIRIDPNQVEKVAEQLWKINCEYVSSVEQHFNQSREINGEILVYGHLNPYGVDPHNRVTMSSDDDAAFQASREFLIEQRARYYRSLAALCDETASIFVGGEKTAHSELGIYKALGGPQNSPAALRNRFRQQQATVEAASITFNWRALSPYLVVRNVG